MSLEILTLVFPGRDGCVGALTIGRVALRARRTFSAIATT